jgi:glycosyltransferase involved in cell wall biosynthesis
MMRENACNADAVSVVMALYNGRRFLEPQVASVLAELGPMDELIVVDDASSDDSVELLAKLGDGRIQIHRNARNVGVLGSFERGLSLACHDIVFLCDQDDVWLPGKRAAFLAAFRGATNPVVVISDAQLIDGRGELLSASFMATRGGFRDGVWSNVFRNRYLGCAMALRREVASVALPLPRYVPMHDMWLGVLGTILGNVTYLPQPYLQYRRHEHNVSPGRRQSWRRVIAWRVQLLIAIATRLPRVMRMRRRMEPQSTRAR